MSNVSGGEEFGFVDRPTDDVWLTGQGMDSGHPADSGELEGVLDYVEFQQGLTDAAHESIGTIVDGLNELRGVDDDEIAALAADPLAMEALGELVKEIAKHAAPGITQADEVVPDSEGLGRYVLIQDMMTRRAHNGLGSGAFPWFATAPAENITPKDTPSETDQK